MHTTPKISLIVIALLCAVTAACGGGSSSSTAAPQPLSVTIVQGATATTSDGQSMNLSATVANDSSNAGVQWSVSGGGSLSNQTTTAATYNAPLTGSGTATVSAIAIADSTKSASIQISYSLVASIGVSITNKVSKVQAGGSAVNLHASLQNDTQSQGVTWSLSAAGASCSPACGSLSGNAANSVTYTPPATVPAVPGVVITATSVADISKTDVDNITIVSTAVSACNGSPSGSESLLTGEYAFLVQGFAGASLGTPKTMAASFAADGSGNVTGGELDVNDTVTPHHLTINASGSSYTVGADHVGCLSLADSGGNTTTFHFALGQLNAGVAAKGRIIEFDDAAGTGTRASGTIRLQDSSSFSLGQLQPHYAFGADGWAFVSTQWQHYAGAGSFAVNTAGVVSSGFADLNQGGTLQSSLSGGTGAVTAMSTTTGRGTLTYSVGGNTFGFALYMIDANEFFLASTNAVALGPVLSGRAIVTASSFTASSLSGNYIVHQSGAAAGTANAVLGLVTLSSGNLTGTINTYDAVNGAASQPLSGATYTVDTTSGRVAFSGAGTHSPVAYISTATDGVSAFIAGTDSDAEFGEVETQPSATYSASSVTGNFFVGTEEALDNTVSDEVGVVSSTSGALSGTLDLSGQTGLSADQPLTGTLTINADGTGNVGANTVAITNGTRLFVLDESGSAAKINVAEQ